MIVTQFQNLVFKVVLQAMKFQKYKKNKFIILNTDPSEKNGEHWTVLFRENEDLYEFFDSLGQHPKKFFFQNFPSKCNFSKTMIQNPFEDTCGYFCLYYIFFKCRGKN